MGFANFSRNFASGLGKFVGASHNILVGVIKVPRNALRKSAARLRPQSSRERIRSIVTEELSRLIGKQTEFTGAELQERLQVMAETILALQERLDELAARGPISEADMFKVMGSLKAAASLTDDERAILANVFRQNIAIQKPELIDTAMAQNSLRIMSS